MPLRKDQPPANLAAITREPEFDYTRPDLYYPGIVPDRDSHLRCKGEIKEIQDLLPDVADKKTPLCWVCGWTPYFQLCSPYTSRIKVIHATQNNCGLWSIGNKWVLRDQPNNLALGNDYITQQFLRSQPGLNVPLVKEMKMLSDPDDQIIFTLMSKAEGVLLENIWHLLSKDQKLNYAKQIGNAVKEWRQITSPRMQKVDGSQLDDILVAHCGVRLPTCNKLGFTRDEWINDLIPALRVSLQHKHDTRDPEIIDPLLEKLIKDFPSCEPYVLTHGDLHLSNIFVKDDEVTAIIDWEMAGFMPWWAERFRADIGSPANMELVDMIGDDLSPGIDEETFFDLVMRERTSQLISLLQAHLPVWHTAKRQDVAFMKPAFCRCRPMGGRINNSAMGRNPGHTIVFNALLRSERKSRKEREDLQIKNKGQ